MNWEIISLLIAIVYTLVWVLLKLNYKIPIAAGVVLLIVSALGGLFIKEESLVTQFAIYAFYFFLSGAIIALINYLRAR